MPAKKSPLKIPVYSLRRLGKEPATPPHQTYQMSVNDAEALQREPRRQVRQMATAAMNRDQNPMIAAIVQQLVSSDPSPRRTLRAVTPVASYNPYRASSQTTISPGSRHARQVNRSLLIRQQQISAALAIMHAAQRANYQQQEATRVLSGRLSTSRNRQRNLYLAGRNTREAKWAGHGKYSKKFVKPRNKKTYQPKRRHPFKKTTNSIRKYSGRKLKSSIRSMVKSKRKFDLNIFAEAARRRRKQLRLWGCWTALIVDLRSPLRVGCRLWIR